MTRGSQKARERAQLDQFAKALPVLPPGPIVPGECPDFTVGFRAELGIDVTEVLRKPTPGDGLMKEQEALRRRVMDLAESLCVRDGVPGLYVEAFFARLTKGRVREAAAGVSGLVRQHVPAPGQSWNGRLTSQNLDWWPREVHMISIMRPDGFEDSLWSASGPAEFLAPCTHETLQEVLDSKETRLAEYRRCVSSVWLLLVMNDLDHSGAFDTSGGCLDATYRSGFDRAFLLRTFDGTAQELSIRA